MSRITRRISACVGWGAFGALCLSSVVVVAAYGGGATDSATASGLSGPSGAARSAMFSGRGPTRAATEQQTHTDVCHRNDETNQFELISVAAPAVAAHLQHGDGVVGGAVPGHAGWVFGSDCGPVSVQVDPLLDQVVDVAGDNCFGLGSYDDLSQTFTVGMTGILAQVDVQLRRALGTGDLAFDIRPTIGGVPVESNGAALVSAMIPQANVPTAYDFVSTDVSSAQIHVAAGDVLAIVLRVPNGSGGAAYCWNVSTSYNYASGATFYRFLPSSSWLSYPGDGGFRTFVVPAP